jgi:CBS domain-containing protein
MTSAPSTIEEGSSVTEAMRTMMENDLVVLPVLDKGKQLKGVVTFRDLLNRGDLRVF